LLTPARQSNSPATTGTAVDAFIFSNSGSSPVDTSTQNTAGSTAPGSVQSTTMNRPSGTASGASMIKQTPAPTGAILLPSQILGSGANHSATATGSITPATHVGSASGMPPNSMSVPNVVPVPSPPPAQNPMSVVTFPAAPVAPVAMPSSSPPTANSSSAFPTPSSSSLGFNGGAGAGGGGGGNLESTLGALEMKVYGNTNKNMPILQRLEHLEKDTNSHTSSGSIADRIQALTKTYGL